MDVQQVQPAEWRLTLLDIENGGGTATVTLRSGVQLTGSYDSKLSQNASAFLRTNKGGWHVIDYTEIAAITGSLR